mgnify:CR=1 FL=1
MTMASIWMLLNVLRVLNSGWTLRIAADCTYKIAINAVALMGFCVNSMGGLHHLVALSIIPEKGGECEASYTETWRAVCNCLHKILTSYVYCADPNCATCQAVREVREHKETKKLVANARFARDKHIPVSGCISDNHAGFRKFALNFLHLVADNCSSHMAGNDSLQVCSVVSQPLT